MKIENYVKHYYDFPLTGVVYWDFSYLLKNVEARNFAINQFLEYLKNKDFDKIVAVESKGFTIGSILADILEKELVLIRKPNLIPGEILSERFIKEYGQAEYQIKKDAIKSGEKVIIFYDIMAGSGASKACINLIEKLGGKVKACLYVTELEYLSGKKDLMDVDTFSLVKIKEKL